MDLLLNAHVRFSFSLLAINIGSKGSGIVTCNLCCHIIARQVAGIITYSNRGFMVTV